MMIDDGTLLIKNNNCWETYGCYVYRKVVKTLLDLGAANVNLRGPDGRTPLHMVAEAGDPEMIAILLDHQADPRIPTTSGRTAIDIIQAVAADALAAGVYNPSIKGDHNRLRLCLELLERAGATLAVHVGPLKLDSGSSVSMLRERGGSSPLLPEESDNFVSMSRAGSGPLTQGAQLSNNDFYSTLPQGKGELWTHTNLSECVLLQLWVSFCRWPKEGGFFLTL
jgi:regulatory protein NPR1